MLRGAKLSVVKQKRRKEVSEETPLNVPIITRTYLPLEEEGRHMGKCPIKDLKSPLVMPIQ